MKQQQGQQDFKDVEARAAWARAWKVKCTECKSLISESADQYGFKSIENPLKQQEFLMMTQWSNGFFCPIQDAPCESLWKADGGKRMRMMIMKGGNCPFNFQWEIKIILVWSLPFCRHPGPEKTSWKLGFSGIGRCKKKAWDFGGEQAIGVIYQDWTQ